MNNVEIKFKSWRLRNDALINGNSRIPLDHISQTVFRIEENDYKKLSIFLAVCLVGIAIAVAIAFSVVLAIIIVIIAAILAYFALQKEAYFKIYSTSGQSISYYLNETNADKLKNEIDTFNLFVDELLNRKKEYLMGSRNFQPSLPQSQLVTKREPPSQANSTCPVCNSDVKHTDYDCWNCKSVFAGNSTLKPIPKVY